MSDLIIVIILGILEGITEFLPVSSTGHLIVATALLNPSFNEATRATFEIFIQFGAILAIIVVYRAELTTQVLTVARDRGVQRLWLAIVIAFMPAALIGVVGRSFI
ncbi:MAG TPA: undecaprenyl-diphosphate phosphatase, partial [Candidatus Limnocylindrales bacterium]|nr:undecaprenyl-diphosphate phosphatase [Candidatus Limnocylindrales bacterium]